jgi:hypothetical protein
VRVISKKSSLWHALVTATLTVIVAIAEAINQGVLQPTGYHIHIQFHGFKSWIWVSLNASSAFFTKKCADAGSEQFEHNGVHSSTLQHTAQKIVDLLTSFGKGQLIVGATSADVIGKGQYEERAGKERGGRGHF